jgi:hypothetical protein
VNVHDAREAQIEATREARAALARVERSQETIGELLARSSLGHLWVDCPRHGRQPVEPFRDGDVCLMCDIEGSA